MIDAIFGIANLRPVFDFLDKSDREEVACVNKACHKMVCINSDVFKKVRKLPLKEAMQKYAREMSELIALAFDMKSDKEVRFTSQPRDDDLLCPFGNDTTYYLNFRKCVFSTHRRVVELHIERFKLTGTKVKKEDIWVYEKDINKDIKTGKDTGFIIDNLSFRDYSRRYSPSRYYSNFFPKYIKSKFDRDLEKRNKKKKARLIV
jgi:hypothetical protein